MNIFGVRHLSPGASYHLIKYLDEKKPACVLIEGPADATDILIQLASGKVKPPVALLGYTTELPIETVLYPFAEYSPEYQAIRWAVRNKKKVSFIDLPTEVTLKLGRSKKNPDDEKAGKYYRFHNDIYNSLAGNYEEEEYESYWERHFEHNLNPGSYREGLSLQSEEIRNLVIEEEKREIPYDYSYNMVREAHMCTEIQRAIADGFAPEDIVVIVGAYHVAGIKDLTNALSTDELKALPRVPTQITLMPYSYHRLSSRTGYGAGNKAPFYFDLMWQHMLQNSMGRLSATYMSAVARELRSKGNHASSASVIEAVRLADALTSFRSGSGPVLKDLHDAVITCFGSGDLALVAGAINQVDIGTAIGHLPEGVSQTPVQEDMKQELKRLKLTDYKSTVAQELSLDLRENLKVKSLRLMQKSIALKQPRRMAKN